MASVVDPKAFDWKHLLMLVLLALVSALGGGASGAYLCQPGACPCCKPHDGEVPKAECCPPAKCCGDACASKCECAPECKDCCKGCCTQK